MSIDGQQIALLDAGSLKWQVESLDLGLLRAGQHTLAFQGMNGNRGDTTASIDAVQLNASAMPEPASLAGGGQSAVPTSMRPPWPCPPPTS